MNKALLLAAMVPACFATPALFANEPATAADNWRSHCQRCHGADGAGKTRIGQRLKLKDYTDAAVNAEITDEEILKVMKDGITDERGREVKPSYSDVLNEDEQKALIAYIRDMVKKD